MTQLVSLNEEDIDNLERRLTIKQSKIIPGNFRSEKCLDEEIKVGVPTHDELGLLKEEILSNYKKGIKIASNIESKPLIPLYKASNVELPPNLKVDNEIMKYDFYWTEITFSSCLENDQYLLSAELNLKLEDDVSDQKRRARPVQFFPSETDSKYFQIDLEGGIGLDSEMKIVIPTIESELIPLKRLIADAKIKAGISIGPFRYQFRKAKIRVTGLSDREINWFYNLESELTGTNDITSILILKTAKEIKSLKIYASLKVIPYKKKWIFFKEILPPLSGNDELPVELVGGA
jgi:hypothetical protein